MDRNRVWKRLLGVIHFREQMNYATVDQGLKDEQSNETHTSARNLLNENDNNRFTADKASQLNMNKNCLIESCIKDN